MSDGCSDPVVRSVIQRFLDEKIEDLEIPLVVISPEEAECLLPEITRFREELKRLFGGITDPVEAFWVACQMDEEAGLSSTAGQFGKGLGWQHMCAVDMIGACEHSIEHGGEIMVYYV